MLRRMISPLHPDGLKFVLVGAAATLVLFLLWVPAGWIAAILTLWLAYFFRDPWRVTPIRAGLLVSPADGIVVSLAPAPPPPELGMGEAELTRIGIFLSIFDVHVTRAPLGGRVAALRYTKGRFVNAIRDEASRHNERMAIRVVPTEGPDIGFVHVAGFVADRVDKPPLGVAQRSDPASERRARDVHVEDAEKDPDPRELSLAHRELGRRQGRCERDDNPVGRADQ